MEEEKSIMSDVALDSYDALDRPFDFVELDAETALICESDAPLRETISTAMKDMGYLTTEAGSAKDALKNMRFHVYNIIIVNEHFDTQNPATNAVLNYLAQLNMSTRRQTFVAMISDRFHTMDNMEAFNKSVNMIINRKNLDDFTNILKHGIAENASFYYVFKEIMKKKGRV